MAEGEERAEFAGDGIEIVGAHIEGTFIEDERLRKFITFGQEVTERGTCGGRSRTMEEICAAVEVTGTDSCGAEIIEQERVVGFERERIGKELHAALILTEIEVEDTEIAGDEVDVGIEEKGFFEIGAGEVVIADVHELLAGVGVGAPTSGRFADGVEPEREFGRPDSIAEIREETKRDDQAGAERQRDGGSEAAKHGGQADEFLNEEAGDGDEDARERAVDAMFKDAVGHDERRAKKGVEPEKAEEGERSAPPECGGAGEEQEVEGERGKGAWIKPAVTGVEFVFGAEIVREHAEAQEEQQDTWLERIVSGGSDAVPERGERREGEARPGGESERAEEDERDGGEDERDAGAPESGEPAGARGAGVEENDVERDESGSGCDDFF